MIFGWGSPSLARKFVFSPLASHRDSRHPPAAVCNAVMDDYAKDTEKEYESENFSQATLGPHFLCGILLNLLFWLRTRNTLQRRRSQR